MAQIYRLDYTAEEINKKLGEVIDQTYNPDSENPQSGKAVAEATMDSTYNYITADDVNWSKGSIYEGYFDTSSNVMDCLTTDYIEVKGGDIALSSPYGTRVTYYDVDKKYVSNTGTYHIMTSYTVPNDGYIRIGMSTNDYESTIEEYGNSDNIKFKIYYDNKFDKMYDDFSTMVKNSVVNAFETTESGTMINVNNVSSQQHGLQVKLTSDTITDFSTVSVTVCGRNLLPYPYHHKNRTDRGITFTDNGDGTVTANGTATADTSYITCFEYVNPILVVGEKYRISGCPVGGSASTYYLEEGWTGGKDTGDNDCIITMSNANYLKTIRIRIKAGTVCDNVVFKPMLTYGSERYEYEPFAGQYTATANSDGDVYGLLSMSPNMILATNTNGVVIECKYVADTDTYIEQIADEQLNLYVNQLHNNSFVANYNTVDGWEEHARGFSSLFKNIAYGEGFLFFTDAHFMHGDNFKENAYIVMPYIEQLFYSSPCSFVLNGGDWLGSYDTQDEALYRLSFINGMMRKKFPNYAMVVGNHDTNYQGYVDENSTTLDGRLDNGAIASTYLADKCRNYYVYNANTFDLYCFDTGTEGSGLSTDYYKNQVNWFADGLKNNDKEHVVIAAHILIERTDGNNVVYPMFSELANCAKAFNERQSYSYNNKTYDFTNTVGKVAFAIGGHNHEDVIGVYNTIPYCTTTNMTSYGNVTSIPTMPLDLCAIDWNNAKLKLYRANIGQASSVREMDIIV